MFININDFNLIKADFVAFDLEFSGIKMKHMEDKYDTFYERYLKVTSFLF